MTNVKFLTQVIPKWKYNNTSVTYETINDFPEDAYGFVYMITYTDGCKYIGKKDLFNYVTKPRQLTGEPRKGHIEFLVKRNTQSKQKEFYELYKRESNWKVYIGSFKDKGIRDIAYRNILEIAKTKRQLTYLEAKWLFKYDVLEDKSFLNACILNKFFKGNLM